MRIGQHASDEGWVGREQLRLFKFKWTAALKREGYAWQGKGAVEELKSVGALEFLLSTKKWQHDELLGRIFGEIRAYQCDAEQLRGSALFLQELKEVKECLQQMKKRAEKKRTKVHYPELRTYLDGLERWLSEEADELPKKIKASKRRNERSPLTIYEKFFPSKKRIWFLDEKIRLDTRLQIQLAKMLSFYLQEYGITRITCARLVMLTYLVAGLAYEDKKTGVLKIYDGGRTLSFRSVLDKIARLPHPIDPNAPTVPGQRRGSPLPLRTNKTTKPTTRVPSTPHQRRGSATKRRAKAQRPDGSSRG